jgi:hypothetical protein
LDDFIVTLASSIVERVGTVVVSDMHICSRHQQQLHTVELASTRIENELRPPGRIDDFIQAPCAEQFVEVLHALERSLLLIQSYVWIDFWLSLLPPPPSFASFTQSSFATPGMRFWDETQCL